MRGLSIYLEQIQNVLFGKRGDAVIAATNRFGGQTHITIHYLDIRKIVGGLLNCAAINAAAALSEPERDAVVPEAPLPVLHWQVEPPAVDGESVLTLTLAGGTTLAFQFPTRAAEECGRALERTSGSRAIPDHAILICRSENTT